MQPNRSTPENSSKKPLIGFVILCLSILLLMGIVTQYIAARFSYQEALGKPLFGHYYVPWSWLVWQVQYFKYDPPLFQRAFLVSGVLMIVLIAVIGFIFRLSNRKVNGYKDVHGSARWAEKKDILECGLLSKDIDGPGVFVGGWADKGRVHYLTHSGPEHVAAIAPTRAGKGISLVVPTLLSWQQSAVIHDIKGELWQMTAGWRKEYAHNVVLKFDPASATGSCTFNPLEEIRINTPYAVGDVQNLVTIIVDPDGKGLEDHWAKTAHAFLTGVILHLRSLKDNANLADVAFTLSNPSRPIEDLYDEMLHNQHPDLDSRSVVATSARDMIDKPDKERGSVLSSAMSYLSIYRDPLVARNTQNSNFRITDLMNYHKPVSLYLVVRPADKDRLKPLMRLIINQIIRVLVRNDLKLKDGKPEQNYKHRLLLMLDEFPSFGKLDVFQESLAYIAGYGIKAYLILQDIAQLHAAYGKNESILSNCHIQIAFAPNRLETAKWLSEKCGQTTVIIEDESTSGSRFGMFLKNVSKSYRHISRPLLTTDECQTLKSSGKDKYGDFEPGEMLVFAAGYHPIYGTQTPYFLDMVFEKRAKMLPPETDRLRAIPQTEELYLL